MPNVQNMPPVADIEIEDIALPSYDSPVKIFKNTRAIDVPIKLNSLAESFRSFHGSIRDTWQLYIEARFDVIHQHINDSMGSVVDFVNDSLVSAQNTFINTANQSVSTLEGSVATFKTEIMDSVANLVGGGVAYSVADTNKTLFSGDTSEDTYDSLNRVLSIKQGPMKMSNIAYDTYSRVIGYTETLDLNNITTSKNYVVSYEAGKIPKITEEIS